MKTIELERYPNLVGADLRRADLRRADLRWANLQGANLQGANLQGANLQGADLSRAILQGADLQWADLKGANLRGANLREADLRRADLQEADLRRADLRGANLQGAINIPNYVSVTTSITPEGQFIGWKKCRDEIIVKLMVGKNAKRSNSTGRKCRAEYVKVLEVIGGEVGVSLHDGKTEYRVGRIVRCDKWEDDRWVECGGGIHFYLTREEAEEHTY